MGFCYILAELVWIFCFLGLTNRTVFEFFLLVLSRRAIKIYLSLAKKKLLIINNARED